LTQAVSQVGSPAIRTVGTPAGNLGTAAPAADCATMLLALGAQVVLQSSEGSRTVPLTDFYFSRGKTRRRADELIVSIDVPSLTAGEGTGYVRVARRKAQDIGKILTGCRLKLEGGTVSEVKISLGALNECITRAYSLEEAVRGKSAAEALGYLKRTFPEEAGLRESYFKAYKEQVTSSAVAGAFSLALEDAAERSGLWQ
jgi:CO/xanthine dehydrogenase FAD-binding subunit